MTIAAPSARPPLAWRELHRHTLQLLQRGGAGLLPWVITGLALKSAEILNLGDSDSSEIPALWSQPLNLILTFGVGFGYEMAVIGWARALHQGQVRNFGWNLRASLQIIWRISPSLVVPTLPNGLGPFIIHFTGYLLRPAPQLVSGATRVGASR